MKITLLSTFLFFSNFIAGQILRIKSGDTTFLQPLTFYEDGLGSNYGFVTKDKIFNGQFKIYEPSDTNKIYIEGVYKDGLKIGIWKYYFATGVLKTITEYKDNFENGLRIDFEEGGLVAGYGQMKNGERDGEWKFFLNGILNYTGTEKNGKREGLWKLYDDKGNLKETHSCQENKFEGEFNAFYSSGKIMTKGIYKNHNKVGAWTYYYENGEKKWEEEISSGKKMFWDENGNPINK